MRTDKIMILTSLQLIISCGIFFTNLPYNLSLLKGTLFIILILITLILLLKRFKFVTSLKLMTVELKRTIGGNLNTRLLTNNDSVMNEVIFSVNELIEQLEGIQAQSIQSQAARKRLLSNISHDIRTPLTSIIGYVDALKDDIATSEAEKQEYIEIISRKSNGLKQLIDEIFKMAKLDADEMPLKEEMLDFAEITREAVIEFLPVLNQAEMEMKIRIPEEKCCIIADRLSILRIIGNLIKNAVHYGKEGRILGIELIESNREYQLLIWDQGHGIERDELKNVFERMYRSDQSRNPLYGGSGLGLAIAKALVEKNGGRIWVESVPWKKTTFGFSIPKIDLRNN